ncbi:MAG TPA: hypothetical protein VHT53_13520 [Candidatus Elarobacter sp.]|nr:hypothetical protein [Candidatus Elarobacter sp.]
MTPLPPVRAERADRYVRRTRMRIGARTSRTLATFSLSEALRLVRLPGEDEGRVYFFRHVALHGVPGDGNRARWLDALQRTLEDLAASAVHGDDPRAVSADAVYFARRQEALEALLRRIVTRRPCTAWFWPLACGGAPEDAPPSAASVVDALRREDGGWTRVAAAVFASAAPSGVPAMLAALPPGEAGAWLRELGDDGDAHAEAAAVPLPSDVRASLASALDALGAFDRRVVWLAALAVALAAPAAVDAGTTVARARATLRRLASARAADTSGAERASSGAGAHVDVVRAVERAPDPERRVDASPREAVRALDVVSERDRDAARADPFDGDVPAEARDTARAAPAGLDATTSGGARTEPASTIDAPATAGGGPGRDRGVEDARDREREHAERTSAAGLFFLLNALARLGIAAELRANPALADGAFPARVLHALALQARVAPHDSVFAALRLLIGDDDGVPVPDDALVRMWARAVRRWCCVAARVRARDVVRRTGRLTMTRTELDVTLHLDAVDLRIRRAGLDFDPGWLPWFGRVVRFHYTAEEDAQC